MEERSLRITGTSTNFFNKLTNTLTKILIPTKISINGMLISMKRNNLIKAFAKYFKDKNIKLVEYILFVCIRLFLIKGEVIYVEK